MGNQWGGALSILSLHSVFMLRVFLVKRNGSQQRRFEYLTADTQMTVIQYLIATDPITQHKDFRGVFPYLYDACVGSRSLKC